MSKPKNWQRQQRKAERRNGALLQKPSPPPSAQEAGEAQQIAQAAQTRLEVFAHLRPAVSVPPVMATVAAGSPFILPLGPVDAICGPRRELRSEYEQFEDQLEADMRTLATMPNLMAIGPTADAPDVRYSPFAGAQQAALHMATRDAPPIATVAGAAARIGLEATTVLMTPTPLGKAVVGGLIVLGHAADALKEDSTP